MKKQAGTTVAFATAICGILPILYEANIVSFILTLVLVTLLLISSLILLINDKFNGEIWKRLVKIISSVEIELVSYGFGLVTSGLGLFQPGWIWLGIIFIVIGGFLIGGASGKGIGTILNSFKKK